MHRGIKLFLEDILTSIERIKGYAAGLSFEEFSDDQRTVDAVLRNLEIIGEAVKHIPPEIKSKYEYDWKSVAGIRDIAIHEYFGLSMPILWDIIQNEMPGLEKQTKNILEKEPL